MKEVKTKINISIIVMFITGIIIGVISCTNGFENLDFWKQNDNKGETILMILNIIKTGYISSFVYTGFVVISIKGNKLIKLFGFVGFLILVATELLMCGKNYETKYLLSFIQYAIAYALAFEQGEKIKRERKNSRDTREKTATE